MVTFIIKEKKNKIKQQFFFLAYYYAYRKFQIMIIVRFIIFVFAIHI